MTLKKLSFAVLALALIIVGIYYFQTSKEKERAETSEKKIQQARETAEAKKKYEKILAELCSKPLVGASAAELYNCKDFNSSGIFMVDLGITPESATKSADLPAYCERKIIEMNMLELLECLDPRIP